MVCEQNAYICHPFQILQDNGISAKGYATDIHDNTIQNTKNYYNESGA